MAKTIKNKEEMTEKTIKMSDMTENARKKGKYSQNQK